MLCIRYFSGTGNSRQVAHCISGYLQEQGEVTDCRSIEETGKNRPEEQLSRTRFLILVYPVYAFDAAPPLFSYIKQLPIIDNPPQVCLLPIPCDPHWINSAAAQRPEKILRDRGYTTVYQRQLIMPSNFVVAYDETRIEQLIQKTITDCKEVCTELLQGSSRRIAIKPAAVIIRMVMSLEHLGARFFGKDLRAGSECTKCGLCAAECPAGNITITEKGVRFSWSCIMCLRCVYSCPQQAIKPRLYRWIPLAGGYSPPRLER